MKSLLPVLAVLTQCFAELPAECSYALEVLLLQDGSTSFAPHIDNMSQFMRGLIGTLKEEYPSLRFGVSSFVDKPIPLRGLGHYGGCNWNEDYCYRPHATLSEDAEDVVSGLTDLRGNLGGGNDYPEDPFDGLIFAAADTDVGWTPPDVALNDEGHPIVRLIVLITDDIPHVPNEAYTSTITGWNWPRTYEPEENMISTLGGFGAHSFRTAAGFLCLDSDEKEKEYLEMCDLYSLIDHNRTLTDAQEARLEELIDVFGPYPWPAPVPNPGDGSLDCAEIEYPTPEQAGDFLNSKKIMPLFLLADPTAVGKEQKQACEKKGFENGGRDCLVKIYEDYAHQMGVRSVVASIDGQDTQQRILDSINAMTHMLCYTSTTEPPLVVPPTGATASTSSHSTDITIPIDDGSPMIITPPSPQSTTITAAPHLSSDSGSVTSESRTETVATTENDIIIVVPPIDNPHGDQDSDSDDEDDHQTEHEEGSSAGVIAGATAGAVGGAAALAGVVYAKFGGAMLGGSPSPTFDAIQQVDTPDSPIERETMEEVTMEMFQ